MIRIERKLCVIDIIIIINCYSFRKLLNILFCLYKTYISFLKFIIYIYIFSAYIPHYLINNLSFFFRSSEDLVHRLFVCIAGVADQLQTNFASDLRNILKCVFLMNSSQTVEDGEMKDESSVSENPVSPLNDTATNHDRQDLLQEYEDDLEETTTIDHNTSMNASFYINSIFYKLYIYIHNIHLLKLFTDTYLGIT